MAIQFYLRGYQVAPTVFNLDSSLNYHGWVSIECHGKTMAFDFSNPHEVRYALQVLTGLPYPQSDIDHALFKTFVRKGDVCLDLGANIGIAALEMLSCGAKKIEAFEPVEALRKRLYALNDPRIHIHAAAVSDNVGFADIVLSRTHNQGHSLDPATVARFPKVFGDDPQTERVITVTLDTLFHDRHAGDVWKIDVEGAEHAVLRGARHLLETAPPRVILCECYEGAAELFALLGPGWSGLRAHLSVKTNKLKFTQLFEAFDTKLCSNISPTYVFYRDDAALPKGFKLGL